MKKKYSLFPPNEYLLVYNEKGMPVSANEKSRSAIGTPPLVIYWVMSNIITKKRGIQYPW